MPNPLAERPFDNFRVAITDPSHFFGRSELIDTVSRPKTFAIALQRGQIM
jgi:hypothetical protein